MALCFPDNAVLTRSVCLVAATYQQQKQVIEQFIRPLSEAERQKIMGLNAVHFYNLNQV